MSLAISNIPKGTVFLLIFAIRNIVLFALHFVPLRSRSSNGTNLMTITISSNLAAKILVKMIKPTKPQQIEGRRKLLRLRIIATKTIKETQVMDEKKTLPMNDVNEIIARATLDDERDLWVSRKRKPEPFDLPGIMDLLNFKDLSFDNHEYREKMADIVSVSANEPLYEVRINERYRPKVVFTSKLKYYVALSDSVVNQSMNEVFALLEEMRKAGDNVQERKNQTEAAIRLVVARIRHFLDTFDTDKDDGWKKDENWKNIVSSTPDLDGNRNFKEMIAFYHYMTAQIFRYQLELNRRYGYGGSLDDIAIFYSEDLLRTPDTGIIDIVPKPRKAKKQSATKADPPNTLDYINNDINDRSKRIDCLRRAWEYWKWIEEDTNVRDFERFFEYSKERPSYDCHINWIAPANVLCLLLRQFLQSGLFKTHTKCTVTNIVKSQFKKVYDSRFKTIDELTRQNINRCINILNPKTSLQTHLQSDFHEDNDDSPMTYGEIKENHMSIRKK